MPRYYVRRKRIDHFPLKSHYAISVIYLMGNSCGAAMHFVYRFINRTNTVIYVGKTSQPLAQRFNLHEHLPAECYEQVEHIEYIECQSAAETQIKEVYYINLYKGNKPYFNILDLAEPINGVMLTDAWTLYEGPLPPAFSNSWNRRMGLKSSGPGTAGTGTMDYLTSSQVNLMIGQYLLQIEQAWTPNFKKVAIRDLLIFTLGINSPLRPKELASLQYHDLFNSDDSIKPLEYKLTRGEKDLILEISYPKYVQDILQLYRQVANLSFSENEKDPICKSRQRKTPITTNALWRRMSEPASAIGLESKIGSNTLRKTYMMNIYDSMDDKVEALLLLDRLNGGSRLQTIANYLGFEQAKYGFDIICECRYPCGKVSIDRVKEALNKNTSNLSQTLANSYGKAPSVQTQNPSSAIGRSPKTYSEVSRGGILAYYDKAGHPISDERMLEIYNHISANPNFLYRELEEKYQITTSTLLRIVTENSFR